MNEAIVEKLFPGTIDKIKNNKCPMCNEEISEFKDELSKKEYKISGMCQTCQDSTFG